MITNEVSLGSVLGASAVHNIYQWFCWGNKMKLDSIIKRVKEPGGPDRLSEWAKTC